MLLIEKGQFLLQLFFLRRQRAEILLEILHTNVELLKLKGQKNDRSERSTSHRFDFVFLSETLFVHSLTLFLVEKFTFVLFVFENLNHFLLIGDDRLLFGISFFELV